MKSKKTCSEKVWRSWNYYPCHKSASVERNGLWYCGTHDPEAVKERKQKKDESRHIQNEKDRLGWAIIRQQKAVCDAAKEWVDNCDDRSLDAAVRELIRLEAELGAM